MPGMGSALVQESPGLTAFSGRGTCCVPSALEPSILPNMLGTLLPNDPLAALTEPRESMTSVTGFGRGVVPIPAPLCILIVVTITSALPFGSSLPVLNCCITDICCIGVVLFV